VRDKYAPHLQDPRVVAAMETLHSKARAPPRFRACSNGAGLLEILVDRRDAGLGFYRLFAAIDIEYDISVAHSSSPEWTNSWRIL